MNAAASLSYVMIAVLMLLSISCLFLADSNQWLPGNRKYIMAAVFFAYAVVRFFRIRKLNRNNSNE